MVSEVDLAELKKLLTSDGWVVSNTLNAKEVNLITSTICGPV
jgi:hypothetical protein